MGFTKKIFTKESFKIALFWITPILGVGFIILAICMTPDQLYGWNILKYVGELLLLGFLFSFISNSNFFFNIHREALTKIVYSDSFLGKRKDIEDIWNKVSKSLFDSKFPTISDELLKKIDKTYLPKSVVSYYSNYRRAVNLTYKGDNTILVEEELTFEVNTSSTNKIQFEQNITCLVKDYEKSFKTTYMVDNKRVQNIREEKTKQENEYDIYHAIDLKGKTSYNLTISIERTMSLNDDPFCGFMARYLIKGFHLIITFPDNLKIRFVERGTHNEFKKERNKNKTILEYTHKGLLLRHQGYIIIINQNEQYESKN